MNNAFKNIWTASDAELMWIFQEAATSQVESHQRKYVLPKPSLVTEDLNSLCQGHFIDPNWYKHKKYCYLTGIKSKNKSKYT